MVVGGEGEGGDVTGDLTTAGGEGDFLILIIKRRRFIDGRERGGLDCKRYDLPCKGEAFPPSPPPPPLPYLPALFVAGKE